MKVKVALLFIVVSVFFVGCKGMSISADHYNEIKGYVETYADEITIDGDAVFFTYKASGLSVGGVNYGYYYSKNNEILIPDYYSGGSIGKAEAKDGGFYLGKPNSGTDWCFVKQIKNHWFYYELHWG